MSQTRSFTPDQVARYARHLILPEVGGAGQRKLLDSSVLLLGAGGLGSPAAMYLAAAGVGKIGIVDFDVVDKSNLQRQLLHGVDDVGRPMSSRYLIVSKAIMLPMIPGSTPNTPASAQLCTLPGGGGSGKRQR